MSTHKHKINTFDPALLGGAAVESLKRLTPMAQWRNPVMFVTWLGALLTAVLAVVERDVFTGVISLWLWFTVLFANFAEALAEGRGKAQAASLRGAKKDTPAIRLEGERRDSRRFAVSSSELRKGDVALVEAGHVIPGDGEVIEGVASVDESAITGESAPVVRASGGDRSAVTGGTRVLSDWLVVRISANPGDSFLDRMIAMVEGAKRQRTPNEIALSILLAALTLVFLAAVATLLPFSSYAVETSKQGQVITVVVLVALLVCLIPTTIGGLLSAIGIAGMDRMIQANVVATSGRAIEAAGDVDVLLLDKTGTITLGNRQAAKFYPAPGVTEKELADAAQLASLADETPEGRSIVVLAKSFGIRARDLTELNATFVPFTAQTRMSGMDIGERRIRKGAPDAIDAWLKQHGKPMDRQIRGFVDQIATKGATPLVVAEGDRTLGVVELRDIIKGGIKERFAQLRRMGIKTVMITGDNRLTAAAIAAEAGVDEFLAEATPEAKLKLIREQQAQGRLVAMCGDGTNDAPALGAGRRCSGDEHRHAGGERGRQHGRPRLEPDQADRGGRDRQADADHARRVDDVLDRERRSEVFRDHPGGLCGDLPTAQRAERDGTRVTLVGDPVGGDLQCADHRRADPACAARHRDSRGHRRRAAAPEPADLRARRAHRSLHRYQGDRPAAGRLRPRLGDIMQRDLTTALLLFLLLTAVTGLAYPGLVTGVAQLAFRNRRTAA